MIRTMKRGVETLTGIRPTANLTIANYIGAVKPLLEDESIGRTGAVFLAELHATTTDKPSDVMMYSHELARTLVSVGVKGEIYSQREFTDGVAAIEYAIRGMTTAARLLRLPTLKEKVVHSDNTENASVALMMYPAMMASDIILARPERVPTGKDQKAHLEITNELIRKFNNTYDADLPEPTPDDRESVNILSLDGSGRKMSKSIPKGAVFLDDTPEVGRRKIMKTRTASAPGPEMDKAVDNLLVIANGLAEDDDYSVASLEVLASRAKAGDPVGGEFKSGVGDIVAGFLERINKARSQVSDADVDERIAHGNEWFRPIAEDTKKYVSSKQWGA